jgi:hypothetical protein
MFFIQELNSDYNFFFLNQQIFIWFILFFSLHKLFMIKSIRFLIYFHLIIKQIKQNINDSLPFFISCLNLNVFGLTLIANILIV